MYGFCFSDFYNFSFFLLDGGLSEYLFLKKTEEGTVFFLLQGLLHFLFLYFSERLHSGSCLSEFAIEDISLVFISKLETENSFFE